MANQHKVYARIDDVDKRNFNMETNDAYETILPYQQASGTDHEVRQRHASAKLKNCKACLVIAIMSIFILSIAGVCTYFAISINQLQSYNQDTSYASVSALQMVNESLLNLHQKVNKSLSLYSNNILQQNQNLSSLQQQLGSELELTNQNLSRLSVDVFQLQNQIQNIFNGSSFTPSCAALPDTAPSGHYWITAPNSFPVPAYCDMTRTCGGVTGGWMRVAQLNIRDSQQECPSGLAERSFNNLRYCTRPDQLPGCTSLNISSKATTYSRVCGRVTAYQYGALDAYRTYYNHGGTLTLEDPFVHGVIVTHGHPRQHVWTLIAARDELVTHNWSGCPCLRPGFAAPPPPFIGDNYFCDSGSRDHFRTDTFYGDDPLWDGTGCESVRGFANTCCTFNSPPWFYRELAEATTDDIEMRFCRHVRNTSDLAVERFELYIQ